MEETVLVAARRTPIGKLGGALSGHTAVQLGVAAARTVLSELRLGPREVDEAIIGHVIQAGTGQNPARQVALGAGLDPAVAAMTVNKVCGSGLKAVMLADLAIRAGEARVILAGGIESMSQAPYLLREARFGAGRPGHVQLLDAMYRDGLDDAFHGVAMNVTGDDVARRHKVTREEADRFALRSHQLAQRATDGGAFQQELVPVPRRSALDKSAGEPVVRDEGIRADTSLEKLERLKPVNDGGIVTAGNASQISDGGAALVLTSARHAAERGWTVLARIAGQATAGMEPLRVMEAPIPATETLLRKVGWTIDEVDLFEHNEAFASASLAIQRALRVPEDRFNVHGGAVALGHPLGCSGARLLTTLVHAMQRYGKDRGVATLCLGGGNGVAVALERA